MVTDLFCCSCWEWLDVLCCPPWPGVVLCSVDSGLALTCLRAWTIPAVLFLFHLLYCFLDPEGRHEGAEGWAGITHFLDRDSPPQASCLCCPLVWLVEDTGLARTAVRCTKGAVCFQWQFHRSWLTLRRILINRKLKGRCMCGIINIWVLSPVPLKLLEFPEWCECLLFKISFESYLSLC